MLESWSISKRIGSGFVILTLMLIGLALFSHRAVGALGTGYSDYRATALQGVAVREAMEDIFEAKIAVLSYVETPVSAQRNEAIGNLDEVLDSTELADRFNSASTEGAERDRLLELTRTYKDRFFFLAGQLVDLRSLQAEIDGQVELLAQNASALFSTAVQNGNPSIVSAAGRVLQAATETTLQGKQYLLTSAPADLDAFVENNIAFNRAAEQLRGLGVTAPLSNQISQLVDASREIEDNLRQFSQNRQAALELQSNVIDQIGSEIDAGFDRFADDLQMRQDQLGPRGAAIVAQLQTFIPIIGIVAVIVAILASFVIGRWINGAVSRLVDTTERLAAGDDEIEVTGTEHKHELSRMARALLVFRDAQVERKQASAERAKLREQQDSVVNTMKSELAQLAAGDLTAKIDTAFASEYEDLRHNFNEAVSALDSAIARVAETAQNIMATTNETNTATNDLSQRTEN
ncbi:MAG: HAMP domain-containing protein, partial [Pseudomonadota bacterium]